MQFSKKNALKQLENRSVVILISRWHDSHPVPLHSGQTCHILHKSTLTSDVRITSVDHRVLYLSTFLVLCNRQLEIWRSAHRKVRCHHNSDVLFYFNLNIDLSASLSDKQAGTKNNAVSREENIKTAA